ncbi:response regulator transcription factor [Burkholderia cenocepacia]|uniref:response regulator transcription factor n=1 Tax=Burkholderia cenocepacia TaxID=95486 RepID=UPI00264D8E63|nr:response regulator transcription factor [Burkholderia cenocepacia]MDN7452295.1 response regulator transcription factor [Burkholderia cenocepacia]
MNESPTGPIYGPATLRIALLDSNEIVRYALQMRLMQELSWNVAGVFRQAGELVGALARGERFDLVIMNHMLDASDGVALVRTLRIRYPETRILVCSEYERADTVSLLFDLGVNGFIGRTQPLDDHVEAARKVVAGNTYFSARIIGKPPPSRSTATDASLRRAPQQAALIDHPDLTARERMVLDLCLHGLSISQVAHRVGRSYKTVSSQKLSAYRKLGIGSDAELIAMLSRNASGM